MSTMAPVDGREVIRCDRCKLVQFKRESEMCVKCKTSYAPPPAAEPEQQVGNVDPTSSLGEGFAAQSAFPHLALTLRQLREELGLSQRQLANRMGVPRTYISKAERSGTLPYLSTIEKYARALNVSVADILNGGSHYGERDPFILEIAAYLPNLRKRDMDYIVDAVRQLATTEPQKVSA